MTSNVTSTPGAILALPLKTPKVPPLGCFVVNAKPDVCCPDSPDPCECQIPDWVASVLGKAPATMKCTDADSWYYDPDGEPDRLMAIAQFRKRLEPMPMRLVRKSRRVGRHRKHRLYEWKLNHGASRYTFDIERFRAQARAKRAHAAIIREQCAYGSDCDCDSDMPYEGFFEHEEWTTDTE